MYNIDNIDINDINNKATIVAYFLSKFDVQAMEYLGYNTQVAVFNYLSQMIGKDNSYIRRRRDEFDVFMNNKRKGYNGRKPAAMVNKFHSKLMEFTFEELCEIVDYILSQSKILDLTIYPDDLTDDSREYKEGTKKKVAINIYERNHSARAKCLIHYGSKCVICDFDASEIYGYEFTGAIHVHHINMISKHGSKHSVNPIEDLRPVCPNCHMILHAKKDGYTIEEVKTMIAKNNL